jgi:flagellar basal-body rod protein FlgG
MLAQQRALDVAADNLANLNTPGARGQRVSFAEMAPELTYLGVPDGEGNVIVDARETGKGVRAAATLQNLNQGILIPTDDPMDIAIDGDGMLEVTLGDGRVAYTHGGSLHLDAMRRLVTSGGAMVSPPIQVPEGIASVQVKSDGSVIAVSLAGDPQTIGKLKLVRFENPEGLQTIGGNALLPTVASGAPIEGQAGEPGIGTVVTGIVESSNIDAREEYLRVVQAQRAYELNVRAMKTMDEMLQDANNLRRQ